jgi:protein-disulfide isomerase
MKFSKPFERVVLAVLVATLLVSLVFGFGCAKPEATPTPTPTPSVYVSGPSRGSLDAPVTIFVFSDFQCGICQQFALTTEKDLERVYIETGKVRLIYKHFITEGDESLLAAEASECAAEQNKFWPYYNLLMQAHFSPSKEDLTLARLQAFAQTVGLNMDTFNDSLNSGKFKDKVNRDTEEGTAAGVTGTPTFFVNGVPGTGNAPFDAFQKIIEQILGGQPVGP